MDKLAIGLIQAPFGLRGELKVRSFSGEADHFLCLEGRSVTVRPVVEGVGQGQGEERVIESVREQSPSLLIKFKGFDSPEKARSLTGCEILVERSRAAPLDDDEYYVADLVGCSLCHQGAVLGTVRTVWESGAHEMLEVRLEDASTEKGWRIVNVPFCAPFVGTVDIATRRIELLVDWILE